jgi:aspartate/methionine/tyrosine aminotransferase
MARLGGAGMGDILAMVAERRAHGRTAIPLHAGEPDFDTPNEIVESAVSALRKGHTHYSPASGLPGVKGAIAEHVSETRGIPVDPEQVVVVPGAKPMIYYAILALCQAGDEVICPDPSYPFYASVANFVGAKVVSLPLTMETGFGFDPDLLKSLVTVNTRLIVLNSPSNPTGGVLCRSDLQTIADLALHRNLWVLSDEIYSHIIYDAPHESIASLPGMADRTILVDGHSKTYSMTGWRLGYGVMPQQLATEISKLVLNTVSCTATFTQLAGAEALRGSGEAVSDMVATFRRRRDRIVSKLNRLPGVACLKPKGAFYVFPKIDVDTMTSRELSLYLLTSAGVATYPGSAFGNQGEGFVRLSFACSEAEIDEGIDRIAAALEKL